MKKKINSLHEGNQMLSRIPPKNSICSCNTFAKNWKNEDKSVEEMEVIVIMMRCAYDITDITDVEEFADRIINSKEANEQAEQLATKNPTRIQRRFRTELLELL